MADHLDALLSLPEIGGPVGYKGMTAIGIRLAVVEPRISAAVFSPGVSHPTPLREAARQVTIPLQVLEEMRNGVSVGIQYLASWLRGTGVVGCGRAARRRGSARPAGSALAANPDHEARMPWCPAAARSAGRAGGAAARR
jgi:hypothetical protein